MESESEKFKKTHSVCHPERVSHKANQTPKDSCRMTKLSGKLIGN
tara:strand:- start:27057 stop:27191 length:135 start_codon:yes stop_codon:yes gene_type:complete